MANAPTTLSGTHGVDPHDRRSNIELRHDHDVPKAVADPAVDLGEGWSPDASSALPTIYNNDVADEPSAEVSAAPESGNADPAVEQTAVAEQGAAENEAATQQPEAS